MNAIDKLAAGFAVVGILAAVACIAAGCPWVSLTCALSATYIAWTAGDDDDDDELDEENEE